MRVPKDSAARKRIPLAALFEQFPDALMAIARVIHAGNVKHNPGSAEYVHDRDKSSDHDHALLRHLIDKDDYDEDGESHRAHMAWRAIAALQEWLEKQNDLPLPPGARRSATSRQLSFDFVGRGQSRSSEGEQS